MPVFTENDFTPGPRFLEELPVSLSQALRARFASSRLRASGPEIMRKSELNLLEGKIDPLQIDPNLTFSINRDVLEFQEQLHPISAQEANRQGKPFGLQFERPTTQEAVDEVIRRAKARIVLESTIASAPRGFMPFMLGLGADMAGQATDPLNLFLSAIPLFRGTAFAARITQQLGPRLARPLLGAIEAGTANAMIEPFVVVGARSEQDNYTIANSLMSIAFGAGMGATFRSFGGELGDFIKKRERFKSAFRAASDVVDAEARIRGEIDILEEQQLMIMFDEAKKLEAEGRFAEAGELYRQIAKDAEAVPSAQRDVLIRRVMEDRLPDDLKNPSNSERRIGMNSLTHEVAFATAVGQTLDGRRVNVEPILKRDPGYVQPFLSAEDKVAIADHKLENLRGLLEEMRDFGEDLRQKEGVKFEFREEAIRRDRAVDLEDAKAVDNELTDREAIVRATLKAIDEEFDEDILPGIAQEIDEEGAPKSIDAQIAELRKDTDKTELIAEGIRRMARECFDAN